MHKFNKLIHYRQLKQIKLALCQALNVQDNLELIATYNFFEEVKSALDRGASASFDGFKCLMVALHHNSVETCAILLSSLSEEELLHFTVLLTQKTADVFYSVDSVSLSVYLNLTRCYRLIDFRDTQHLDILLRFYQNWLRDSLTLAYKKDDKDKIRDITESIACVFDRENTIKIQLLSCIQLRYDVSFNKYFSDIVGSAFYVQKIMKLRLETIEELLNWCVLKNQIQYFNLLTLHFDVKLAALMPIAVSNNHTTLFVSIFDLLSDADKIKYVPYLQQSFLESAFFGRFEIFQMLVFNKYVDINTKNDQGRTVLHLSVIMDRVVFVEALLDERTDERFESHLENKNFLNAQDLDKRTALHYAVLYKNIPLMKMLVKQKVNLNIEDLNGDTALSLAINTHQLIVIHFLLQEGAVITSKAWLQAIKTQEYSTLEIFTQRYLTKNANFVLPDSPHTTGLHSVTLDNISGHQIFNAVTATQNPLSILMIQIFKEQRVNLSSVVCEITSQNLLHYACSSSSPSVVEALLNHIDVNAALKNTKQTALHIAVLSKRPAIIQQLLNAGADVNLKDGFGYSARDYALLGRDSSIISFLTTSKVPPSLVSNPQQSISEMILSEDAQSSDSNEANPLSASLVLG